MDTNSISFPFSNYAVCCANGANNPTCTLEKPCGTLMNYPREDPIQNGFVSGTYYDGSPIYAGLGDFR